MVQLKYRSFLTEENIEYYLSIISDESTKKDFINTLSKIDVRISTNPIISSDQFYYKIWIMRKGTKKKAHIKYYPLVSLKKISKSPLTLAEIFVTVRLIADIPDDFEEYCEIRFEDPSNELCRKEYLAYLKEAKRFKKFLNQDEISSIPFLPRDATDAKKEIEVMNMNNEANLKSLRYSIIYLDDKREYHKLAELQNTLNYQAKIVEYYGFNTYTGEIDTKVFPITKEDKQMKNISKDFKNYSDALSEYDVYLKDLIKKYNIKQSGNLLKRIAFNIKNDNDNKLKLDHKYITTVIDSKYFS